MDKCIRGSNIGTKTMVYMVVQYMNNELIRGKYVNNYIKQLLSLAHGGVLWMEKQVSIDVDLIIDITGLPTEGEKPEQYLDGNTKEKDIVEEMRRSLILTRGKEG
jgi:hypothetical protein